LPGWPAIGPTVYGDEKLIRPVVLVTAAPAKLASSPSDATTNVANMMRRFIEAFLPLDD
jgi:hypothetical protein